MLYRLLRWLCGPELDETPPGIDPVTWEQTVRRARYRGRI